MDGVVTDLAIFYALLAASRIVDCALKRCAAWVSSRVSEDPDDHTELAPLGEENTIELSTSKTSSMTQRHPTQTALLLDGRRAAGYLRKALGQTNPRASSLYVSSLACPLSPARVGFPPYLAV